MVKKQNLNNENPKPPKHKLKYGYFCTVGKIEDGRLVAVCTDGDQNRHHDVTVLSTEVVQDEAEAKAWFQNVIRTRPWNNPPNTVH